MITVEKPNGIIIIINKQLFSFVVFHLKKKESSERFFMHQKKEESFISRLIISVQMSSNYHYQLDHLEYDFVSFPWL